MLLASVVADGATPKARCRVFRLPFLPKAFRKLSSTITLFMSVLKKSTGSFA
jgi:hypothetical protein